MSKKIRELEEENRELKRGSVTRNPKLNICINSKKIVYIPYFELDSNIIDLIDCEYKSLAMEDVPEDARARITQKMLDEYNSRLLSKEIIDNYKEERRWYEQIKEHSFDINLKILNDGNMKARDIRIEVKAGFYFFFLLH